MTKINDEFFDEELVGIGVRFTDETAPKEMPTMEHREGPGSQKKPEQKRCEAVDAKYVPVSKGGTSWAPSPTERLKKCVRGVGPLAVISGVLFWWQQAGLLDPKAAWPSFVVLALLAGLEIGRSALRGGNT